MLVFTWTPAHKILHSYKEFKNEVTKHKGQKGAIFESRKILYNKRHKAHLLRSATKIGLTNRAQAASAAPKSYTIGSAQESFSRKVSR